MSTRRCLSSSVSVALMITVLVFASAAQNPIPVSTADNLRKAASLEPPRGDSLVNVIVEFTDQPAFLARTHALRLTSASAIESRFRQFERDLEPMLRRGRQLMPMSLERRRFSRVFSGVAMQIPASVADQVRSLPYVRSVSEDRKVRMFRSSNPKPSLIPLAFQTASKSGAGVTIGILDTGVDYLHPALGGGFGPGFKVVGGWDFINNDADPMDDEGHGTHVAGIAAGNGSGVTGVAPNASIIAYKVLDHEGYGANSVVLEAIERTVDPDQNGNPDDRIPIVNMSLGNDLGLPTDPTSVAVNNATLLGVTFIIAAGNSGYATPVQGKEDNYFFNGSETVGSPGSAELAITVGAVDSAGQLALFSSKGPVTQTYALKPDVLAPGVDIVSAALGGGTTVLSGTSMATPYVAGVAALLLEQHPSLTPYEIRSAIVHTARSIGLSAYQQGAGIVDPARALQTGTSLAPGSLSLGLDDPSVTGWTVSDTIVVQNRSEDSQTYTISSGVVPTGVSISVAPAVVTVPASGTSYIVVTLSANNAVIPIVAEDIRPYSGILRIAGTLDTVTIPWAFVRTSVLGLTFDRSPGRILIAGANNAAVSGTRMMRWTNPTRAEVVAMPADVFEIVTTFGGATEAARIAVREQVPYDGASGNLAISSAEATHQLRFKGMDHTGSLLSTTTGSTRLLQIETPNWGPWMIGASPASSDTVFVSPVSHRYSIVAAELRSALGSDRTLHVAQFAPLQGVSADLDLVNSGPYQHHPLRFIGDPDAERMRITASIYKLLRNNVIDNLFGWYGLIDTVQAPGGIGAFDLYLGAPPAQGHDVSIEFTATWSDSSETSVDLLTIPFTRRGDTLAMHSNQWISPTTAMYPNNSTIVFGANPSNKMLITYNNAFGPGTVQFNLSSRGPNREWRIVDDNQGFFTLRDASGGVVASNSLSAPRPYLTVAPGVYSLEVSSPGAWVRGRRSQSKLNVRFDLEQDHPDPLLFTSLMLRNAAGLPSDSLGVHEAGSLVFAGKAYGTTTSLPVPESTAVWFRPHGTEQWNPLPVEFLASMPDVDGSIFRTSLSAATAADSQGIDLRIRMVHPAGHVSEQTLAPAFAVGAWDGRNVTDVPPQGDPALPQVFTLDQNFPNPFNPVTVVRFGIPVAARVRVGVYDLLGRLVDVLADEWMEPGDRQMEWSAERFSSGVYLLRLESRRSVLTRKMVLLR